MIKNLFQGCLTRKMYFVRYVISIICFMAGLWLLNLVAQHNAGVADSYMVGFFFLFLVVYVYQLSMDIRRLRDAGQSPFWAILTIIVPLRLFFFIYLLLVPSKRFRCKVT